MHGDQVQIYTGLSNSLQICTSAMVEVPDSAKSSTGGVILGALREVETTRVMAGVPIHIPMSVGRYTPF